MDNIIARRESLEVPGRGPVTLLHFHSGPVLVVGRDSVGLYRDDVSITDPLGNGLAGYEPIPPELRPDWVTGEGYVRRQTAGYVGLTSGAVLFLRPDGVALFPDNQSALHNRDMCWVIPYPAA